MTDTATSTITDEQAQLLALHAIVVQGGYSTAEVERERAEKDLARGATFDDAFWEKIRSEVDAAATKTSAEPPASGSMIDRIKRYKDLRAEQKAQEDLASGLKAEADLLERELIDWFIENDMQNTKIDGKTVYLHPTTFAQRREGCTAEQVKQALIDSGLPELVTETVNSNTLSAYVRQMDKAEEPLPGPLAEVVELGSRIQLRIR